MEQARILLGRGKQKKPEKSMLLTGLRGVEKTVLLNEIERKAKAAEYRTIVIEAHEDSIRDAGSRVKGMECETWDVTGSHVYGQDLIGIEA